MVVGFRSFFSAPKVKKPDEGASGGSSQGENKNTKNDYTEEDDSPVKKTPRHKARVIESDSEEEGEQVPSTSSSPHKSDEEKENMTKTSQETSTNKEEENVKDQSTKQSNGSPSTKKDVNTKKKKTAMKKSLTTKKGVNANKEKKKQTKRKKIPVPRPSQKKNKVEDENKNLEETELKESDDEARDTDTKDDKSTGSEKNSAAEDEEEMETEGSDEDTKTDNKMQEDQEDEIKEDASTEKKENEMKESKNEPTPGSSKFSTVTTPEKSSTSSLKRSPGFTPETVPPIRKTARKQMKRKSDSLESKQTEMVKRLKGDNETSSTSNKEGTGDEDSELEKDEEENLENKKQKDVKESMEVDNCDDAVENKESPVKTKEKAAQGRLKPKAIHSFFAPRPAKQNDTSLTTKSCVEEDEASEEENDSSPRKKDKSQKNESSPGKDSSKASSMAKKPVINPFAPKPAGADDMGASYNPAKSKYHPITDAFWKRNEKVPYLALAKTMELIEKTSGRLKTIEILANLFRSVIVLSPDDLLHCVYLCLNKVAPAFEGVELGIGETILMSAIAQASGRSMEKIKLDAEQKGDLGIVAEQSRSNQRIMFQPAKLTVRAVFDKLKDIALMTGNASRSKKVDKVKGMFVACRFSEARYLIRSLGGKLRIGLAEQSVLQAIAQACFLTPPGQEYPPEVADAGKGIHPDNLKTKLDNYGFILKTTYCEFPSYDEIIPILLNEGLEELPNRCQLTPGIPLKPMLAHPTPGVSEVLKRFENAKFTCEYKYDGERAQIHLKEDGTVNIYSRNQEDNTSKYPDIIARLKGALGEEVKSCVIDSEAVAWDREKKQILPFQILSTRRRKNASESEIKVQVCVFPFDLLYLNGKPLVREPFEQRRALLREHFKEVEGEFVFAKSMDSTNTEDIEEFLEESIKGNCEGLMVKTLDVDATYEISKRSRNWLKLKKDYLDGVGDTIDVVVLGGYMGKGKRAGHYGGFLLACYDPDNEEYQTLCRIGTGFTDEELQTHSAFFKDHIIEKPKSYYRYENSVAPDQWFDAVQVWEIKCADLSISPVHKAAAGIVDREKGISLRFPRFLRIREDKVPEDATSASQIADLYNSQDQIKNKKSSGKTVEEDFY
ncbi:DNA ligase 1-like isoform X4 [Homarus americanus]|uniref:DNA ligase 1-like isoform X4 n=1 Tax=Homarus americanus TaxID=6706 RepID=UPI001C43F08C|nr:DNA ligase 1-like isoform X4 [Homarus americanus]